MKSRQPVRRQALAVCHDVLTCTTFDEVAGALLAPMARCLGSPTAVLLEFEAQDDRFRLLRHSRHDTRESTVEDYARRYAPLDPVYLRSRAESEAAGGRARRFSFTNLRRVAGAYALNHSEFYADFLRPNDVHHVLGASIRPGIYAGHCFGLGFHRPRTGVAFGEHEEAILRQAGPALFAVLYSITMTQFAQEKCSILEAMSHATTSIGVAVLDENFCIRQINDRAREILGQAEPTGLAPRDGNVQLPDQVLALCRALDACRPASPRTTMRLPLRSTSGRRRDVSVALQRFEAAPGRPIFVVTLSGSDLDDTLEPHARALGMTPREIEVVRHVAQGASNCEIAHSLSLSVRTIENHLRSIFCKADATSRTHLMRRLLDGDAGMVRRA